MIRPSLLRELAAAGLHISQHQTDPRPDEWFAGLDGPYGDVGPEPSAEAALVAGVRWLIGLYRERAEPQGRRPCPCSC